MSRLTGQARLTRLVKASLQTAIFVVGALEQSIFLRAETASLPRLIKTDLIILMYSSAKAISAIKRRSEAKAFTPVFLKINGLLKKMVFVKSESRGAIVSFLSVVKKRLKTNIENLSNVSIPGKMKRFTSFSLLLQPTVGAKKRVKRHITKTISSLSRWQVSVFSVRRYLLKLIGTKSRIEILSTTIKRLLSFPDFVPRVEVLTSGAKRASVAKIDTPIASKIKFMVVRYTLLQVSDPVLLTDLDNLTLAEIEIEKI
jgi:hypothetical protein